MRRERPVSRIRASAQGGTKGSVFRRERRPMNGCALMPARILIVRVPWRPHPDIRLALAHESRRCIRAATGGRASVQLLPTVGVGLRLPPARRSGQGERRLMQGRAFRADDADDNRLRVESRCARSDSADSHSAASRRHSSGRAFEGSAPIERTPSGPAPLRSQRPPDNRRPDDTCARPLALFIHRCISGPNVASVDASANSFK